MIVGVLIGGLFLYKLKKSQENTLEHSVPTLISSQVLENQLARVFTLSDQLRRADASHQIPSLQSAIQNLKDEIRITVVNELELGLQVPSLKTLLIDVNLLADTVDELAPIRQEQILLDQSLKAHSKILASLRSAFNERIEPQTIELGTELALMSTIDVSEQELRETIDIQNELTALSFLVSTIIDIADQLSKSGSVSIESISTSRVQHSFKSATQILITLENDEFRKEIAVLVQQLHELIFGSAGIVDNLKSHIDLQVRFEEIRQRQSNVSQEISTIIKSIVSDTRSHITQSSSKFSATLLRTVLVLVLTGLLVVLTIALTAYIVIERQFNQRMSKLTESVLAIADGDVERKVDIEGSDEIGLMASALSVFKDNAKELLHSNRELEQFAYAASHDLRSPLRAIENLAQWTLEDSGDKLSQSGHDNLVLLMQRASRLSVLQTDLLEYSKAGRAKNEEKQISIAGMVQDLSSILDPDGNFSIEVVDGDESVLTQVTPLRQVLLNLYSNAMKHHDTKSGRLKIEVSYSGSTMQVSFSDDGPGIDPEYHSQIFGLFKRLQSQDVVEGSGLGLSLVLKLVERQGGCINVNSNPKVTRGTTFTFDWPIKYTPQMVNKAVGF